MKQSVKVLVFTLLALGALLLPATANKGSGPSWANTKSQLPKGNWTFSAHPYLGPGYDSRPAVVYSVTADTTATITRVVVWNRSSKPITAVKLSWYLSTEQAPESILQQGQTPLIELPSALLENHARKLDFPVVSLTKICKPLLKGGVLNGDFRIEVAVSEVRYEDGSTWVAQASKRAEPSFVKVANRRVSQTSESEAPCPYQKCQLYEKNGEFYYKCDASSYPEYCTNNVIECTDRICGKKGIGPILD
jgi:hypothetical protein